MVDMDKHACRQLAENGYKNGQWPERYITWEFLSEHPRAMESGYLQVEWNSIPELEVLPEDPGNREGGVGSP